MLPDAPHDDQDSMEGQWTTFGDAVYPTAFEHLGPANRKHQEWYDENKEEIQALLSEKHSSSEHIRATPPHNKERRLRQHKAQGTDETSGYAGLVVHQEGQRDTGLCRQSRHQAFLRRSEDCVWTTVIWLLPSPHCLWNAATNREEADPGGGLTTSIRYWTAQPRSMIRRSLAYPKWRPTGTSTTSPLKIKSEKPSSNFPGAKRQDQMLPAWKMYKAGGPALRQKLTELFQTMWSEGQVPQRLKDATLVHVYKRKGNCQSCNNHRGISVLSIAGKILTRVLLNCLLQHLEQGLLPESQCGFRAGRGTADMIFASRQLQEKCEEQHRDLFMTFIDLTKAFDMVSREGLYGRSWKSWLPAKYVHHDRPAAPWRHDGKVLDDGDESKAFPVTKGVKQGCVLAPTLFSMIFSAMLTDWQMPSVTTRMGYTLGSGLSVDW